MDMLLKKSFAKACLIGSYKRSNPALLLTTTGSRHFARRGKLYPKGSFLKDDTLSANSGFPKHKELFTEGYYQGEPKPDADFDKEFGEHFDSSLNQRFDEMNEKYKRDAIRYTNHGYEIPELGGGILKTYKKQAGHQSIEELVEGDYWTSMKDNQQEISKYFNNVQKDEIDMMNNTKNYTMRVRLNREIQHTEDFRKRFMTQEYGNYEKYERNRINVEYKEHEEQFDRDKIYDKYLDLVKRLPTKWRYEKEEQKRQEIHDIITDPDRHHKEFSDQMFTWRHQQETLHDNEEEDILRDQEADKNFDGFEDQYFGRMSPFAKEQLYKEYMKGMTVKDLSLKYGLLQQRVKAIIYQKYLYWEEVYPKMGETHMRLAIEKEAAYAADYPFIEYGQDIDVMAEMEKGTDIKVLTRTEYDTNPPDRSEYKRINYALESYHSRKSDRIPETLHGSGLGALLLQDWKVHRGKGAPRVSNLFKFLANNYGGPNEFLIKKYHLRKMDEGGLRFASMSKKNSS